MTTVDHTFGIAHARRAETPMNNNAVSRVVTTVHGTFAKHAHWIDPDSPLGCSLKQHFADTVVVEPFHWSGRNDLRARAVAKDRLREHLHAMRGKYKGAQQFIVAHSHGGNVALSALRDEALLTMISGVACLATPFLISRRRVLAGKGMTTHVGLAVGALLFGVMLLFELWLKPSLPAVLLFAVVFGSSIGLLVALVSPSHWRRIFEQLEQELQVPTLSAKRLLIVRAPGDEASTALIAFKVVSQLSVRLYLLLHHLHAQLYRLLERWKAHRLRLLAMSAGLAVAGIVTISLLKPASVQVAAVLLLLFSIYVLFWTLMGSTDVAAGPLNILGA